MRIILGRLNTLRTAGGGVDSAAGAPAAAVEAVAAVSAAGLVKGEEELPKVAEAPLRIIGCCCPFLSAAAMRREFFKAVEALPFFFFFLPVVNWVNGGRLPYSRWKQKGVDGIVRVGCDRLRPKQRVRVGVSGLRQCHQSSQGNIQQPHPGHSQLNYRKRHGNDSF